MVAGCGGIFIKKVLLVWVFVGVCWLAFSFILEVVGVTMAPILVGFWGLVASLVALGAQFAPRPPGAFPRRALFTDFGFQRAPKGVPKSNQNQEKNCPTINPKPMRCFMTFGCFLVDFGGIFGTLGPRK